MIRQHPPTGYEIVKDVDFPWPVAQMVLQHHESVLHLLGPEVDPFDPAEGAGRRILRLDVAQGMTRLERDALDKTMQGHLDLKQVLASRRSQNGMKLAELKA